MSAPTLRSALEGLLEYAEITRSLLTSQGGPPLPKGGAVAVRQARAALDAEERGEAGAVRVLRETRDALRSIVEYGEPPPDEVWKEADDVLRQADRFLKNAGQPALPPPGEPNPCSCGHAFIVHPFGHCIATGCKCRQFSPWAAAPPASEGPPSLYAGASRESEQLREQRHVEASRGPAPAGEPLPSDGEPAGWMRKAAHGPVYGPTAESVRSPREEEIFRQPTPLYRRPAPPAAAPPELREAQELWVEEFLVRLKIANLETRLRDENDSPLALVDLVAQGLGAEDVGPAVEQLEDILDHIGAELLDSLPTLAALAAPPPEPEAGDYMKGYEQALRGGLPEPEAGGTEEVDWKARAHQRRELCTKLNARVKGLESAIRLHRTGILESRRPLTLADRHLWQELGEDYAEPEEAFAHLPAPPEGE